MISLIAGISTMVAEKFMYGQFQVCTKHPDPEYFFSKMHDTPGQTVEFHTSFYFCSRKLSIKTNQLSSRTFAL